MINEATLNDLAREFNLGLSREELAKSIADEKAFQSMGRFDRNQMNLDAAQRRHHGRSLHRESPSA